MSAYIRKTDGVYISAPKNDKNMDDKTLRFTEDIYFILSTISNTKIGY
jgi:hypothetical protein